MKTRKQKTPQRARPQPARKPAQRLAPKPARHGAARRGPTAARDKPARGKSTAPKPGRSRARGARAADRSLILTGECTVAAADALKSQLAGRLEEPGPVMLDVSALQRIDTAGLQLLAAFVRDRRNAGRPVEWCGRAPALEAAAGLLGLTNMLELPGEAGR